MDATWWVFGVLALVVAVIVREFIRSERARAASDAAQDAAAAEDRHLVPAARPAASTAPFTRSEIASWFSTSTREYDPNAYRIDGIARPEYRITYVDADGVVTEREIYVDRWFEGSEDGAVYYSCWCFLKDERRTFRQDRIQSTVNLSTGRRIKSIAKHLMR